MTPDIASRVADLRQRNGARREEAHARFEASGIRHDTQASLTSFPEIDFAQIRAALPDSPVRLHVMEAHAEPAAPGAISFRDRVAAGRQA